MSHVGVCGTDLQILNGSRPDSASILGHEGIGVVTASDRVGLGPGQQVLFNPAAELASGRILGHNTPGLFQQLMAVGADTIAHGLIVPIPGDISPICGALIEPLGAVIYGHELLSGQTELRSVVIFGAGPVGLLAYLYLTRLRIRTLLVHTSSHRLDSAAALGIVDPAATIVGLDGMTKRALAWNQHAPFDGAFICTTRQGAPKALSDAMKLVKRRGCIDLVTNYPEHAPAPGGVSTEDLRAVRAANVCGAPRPGKYLIADVAFTGHRGTSADHLIRATRELQQGADAYEKVVTHILSLGEAASAIQALARASERALFGRDCIKAVIDMARA